MNQEIYLFDLIGTFAFAVYGSYFAIKKDFDLFGIFVCAFLTGVGGGTVRCMMLDALPFYFSDNNYIITIGLGAALTILAHHRFAHIEPAVLIADAIGLVAFAFIGASKAEALDLGLFPIVLCATLTAVGGGVLRDFVLNQTPEIMHRDLYATIAALLGLIYALFPEQMQNPLWANLLIFTGLSLRLWAIRYRINLWKPKPKPLPSLF